MGFRFRLASFVVAVLVAVQALTAALAYGVTRRELIGEGERQLGIAAEAFARQLDDISARVAASVQVLALDYPLRSAIAQRDQPTIVSALRNHGRRVGATRMLLVGIDGRIQADSNGSQLPQAPPVGENFPYHDLLDEALDHPSAAVVAWDGRAYWMVVVPVFAPTLVGLIAAAIPVDDPLLARLQAQSALPKSIELATAEPGGEWIVVARGSDHISLTHRLTATSKSLPAGPKLLEVDGREFVAQAVWLNRSKQSAPVAAVLGYSVDEALKPYRSVAKAWIGLLLLGLVLGLIGAGLIARTVSQPVEQLAESARRIAGGDYSAPRTITRGDELGELASAFTNMTQAIREREAHISFQAGHDQVTGLSNRVAAETAIQRELAAHPERAAALLMVGLSRVPEIIKTMGHAICDRMMRDAGERIRRPAGDGFIARATDAEFSIFLPASGKAEAIAAAFRVVDALSVPYQESDLTLDLAPAVGIALFPSHGAEATALLRRAEVALIAALGSEEPIVVYEPATDPHRPERLSLMGDLREALDHNQLQLQYQPKLNLATGLIDGAEGLVRWQHARLGMVPPDDFIALAEETGNIRRLTRWALSTGIAQAQRWNASDLPFRVSVNVSARDLDDADLPRRVAELLAIHKVSPERIVMEVTESAVMGKPDAAIAVLRRLADLGIDLAIDDFGVGQSSFAYLRRLPVRELKIDKTFIERLADTRADRTIVRSIVELGHHLGYRVTAEGVDDLAALEYLTSVGCDHAQGYFIGRAMTPEMFDRFVAVGEWPGRLRSA